MFGGKLCCAVRKGGFGRCRSFISSRLAIAKRLQHHKRYCMQYLDVTFSYSIFPADRFLEVGAYSRPVNGRTCRLRLCAFPSNDLSLALGSKRAKRSIIYMTVFLGKIKLHMFALHEPGLSKHTNCVSCGIQYMRVPPWVVGFFPWGIPQLQSDWRLSCDTTDLIMRVNVRTTTTTTTT